MKQKDRKLEDFIERCRAENDGHPPQMIGQDEFRRDLTLESYEQVKKMVKRKIEAGEFKKSKKRV